MALVWISSARSSLLYVLRAALIIGKDLDALPTSAIVDGPNVQSGSSRIADLYLPRDARSSTSSIASSAELPNRAAAHTTSRSCPPDVQMAESSAEQNKRILQLFQSIPKGIKNMMRKTRHVDASWSRLGAVLAGWGGGSDAPWPRGVDVTP